MVLTQIYYNEFNLTSTDPGIADFTYTQGVSDSYYAENSMLKMYSVSGNYSFPFMSAFKSISTLTKPLYFPFDRPCRIETRLTSQQLNTVLGEFTGLVVSTYISPPTTYWRAIGFTTENGNAVCSKGSGGSGFTNTTYSSTSPNVTAHKYQIFYVPLTYPTAYTFTDHSGPTVNPGYMSLWYSSNNGVTYSLLDSGTFGVNVQKISLSFASGVGYAFFDYLSVYVDNPGTFVISNQSPAAGSTTVPRNNSLISFNITNHLSPIVKSYLTTTVDQALGLSNNTFYYPCDGGSSSITKITDGYRIVLNYDGYYFDPFTTITVHVGARDAYGGTTNQAYSFSTKEIEGVRIMNVYPVDGYVDMIDSVVITCRIEDFQSGVDTHTIKINILGSLAFDGSTFYSPYNNIGSSMIFDGIDGYVISLKKNHDYAPLQVVPVTIQAKDRHGN